MDPGPVPAELQGLTHAEELLISALMPMMVLYRLPHGQLGYSGHIVNLPQDMSSSLPRLRREGASESHMTFEFTAQGCLVLSSGSRRITPTFTTFL